MFLFLLFVPALSAQVSATLSGTVTDQSGATVSNATVTVKDLETGALRTTTTGDAGHYQVFSLPVGEYEVQVTKQGFAEQIQTGIRLLVGQDANVNITLRVGTVSQQITVKSDAPLVSVTTADISGLVGEQQVKDLPLNGRSFDLLLSLNPDIVNFTSEKTGGIGISNSTTGNNFAVSGNRPQQNLFLLNGVEYTGAAENNMQPGGASQQLLGVDAVREFNVLRDSYGAEYGKRPGGQVIIVTQSGSNQLHGSVFEFLRNNALDAPNYFDQGSAPPFRRNQFGAALGGPIQKDKTFVFANYEGFRQSLHQTSAAFVPDAALSLCAGRCRCTHSRSSSLSQRRRLRANTHKLPQSVSRKIHRGYQLHFADRDLRQGNLKSYNAPEDSLNQKSIRTSESGSRGKVSEAPNRNVSLKYRPDIDGLRAVAVLSVLAFHIGAGYVHGGFVGVDVFFVISGYLISAIIFSEIAASRFSVLGFYERRIRRIFPALFAMLIVFSMAASFYLLPTEFVNFAKSLLSATASASNFYFWRHSGYFDLPESNPLLHTWSLAVEEQFYILFPVCLVVIRRFFPQRLRTAVVILFSLRSVRAINTRCAPVPSSAARSRATR